MDSRLSLVSVAGTEFNMVFFKGDWSFCSDNPVIINDHG